MTDQTPAPATAPGWYADPHSPGVQRYWDGAAWTEHRAPGAPAAVVPVARRGNGFGVAAIVLGIFGFLICLIPFGVFFGGIVVLAGVILGAIGAARSPRVLSIVGGSLSLLAIIVGLSITIAVIANAPHTLAADPVVPNVPGATSTVEYDIVGDGTTASVTYGSVSNGEYGQQQDTAAALPWTKSLDVKRSLFNLNVFTIVAQADGSATTITCKIMVDGKVVSTHTSTGAYSVVTCSSS